MRISSRVAIILVIFSGQAFAKGKKDAPGGKTGAGMMDSNDPVEHEKSDEGPFAPKGKIDEAGEPGADDHPEPAAVVKARPRDKIAVFGNILIGFGRPPQPGVTPDTDAQEGKGTSFTFMAGGHYDVSPAFTVGLRVPWTTSTQRQYDGISASAQALGAPELMGEYRVPLGTLTRLPIDFGVGIPIAQGNYDKVNGIAQFRQVLVNDLADAASGYRDGELFSPRRVPVIVGVGIEYERQALTLHAGTKFVIGVNAGGKLVAPPDSFGTLNLKSVTFRDVTSGGIAYEVLDKPKLNIGLESWLAYNAINAVEYTYNGDTTKPTRFQFMLEPRLGARFGKISPSLGYVFPIGGRLADTKTTGLELHCDVAF